MSEEKKNNKMGLLGAISYIIGNIVGSGIFITPTGILQDAHSIGASLIIWVAAAGVSILGAFVYVELGTSIRESGADFAYINYVKWYPLSFSFMFVGCLITYPATLAIQAQTFSEYIFQGFGISDKCNNKISQKLVGFCLMWLLMFLNFFSIKTVVSRFQIVASAAKLISTAIIIVTGFYFLIFKSGYKNLADPFSGQPVVATGLVTALFSGLYSYDGWDILNFGMSEIENPKKTMPLAIIFGLTGIAVIYLALNISYFAVLDPAQMLISPAVAVTFAKETLGDFQYVMPFLISIVLIGSMNSTIFSASRYLHSAAKKQNLPGAVACTNMLHDSPRVAILVHVIVSIICSFVGDLDDLINYVSFCQWSQRGCTMVALLYIRFKHVPVHHDASRMPIIMPIIFFFFCAGLVGFTIIQTFSISSVGLSALALGLVCYILFMWRITLSRFPAYRAFAQKINQKSSIIAQVVFNGLVEVELTEEEKEIENNNSSAVFDNHGLEMDEDTSSIRRRAIDAKIN